jgi:hypothetical protein
MRLPQEQPTPPKVTENANLPFFNEATKDEMGLGHTPSTRSAELVAGARAYLTPNDETRALSRMAGLITARLLTNFGGAKNNILWFFPARMMGIELLTERLIAKDKSDLLLVDLAAGFSPRGLHLARNYPQADIIEIDLPSVVAEKKRRLKSGNIAVPSNLRWIEANLGETNLVDILEGRKADLITSEGLTLYLTEYEQTRFFRQVEANLAEDGIFIGEVYFGDKLQKLRQSPNINAVASFVFRMVGNVPGVMPNEEVCHQRLVACGLGNFEEYPVVDLMETLKQPKPVDVISVIVARKTPKAGVKPVQTNSANPSSTPTQPSRDDHTLSSPKQ